MKSPDAQTPVNAVPPEEFTGLELGEVKEVAAGWPAIAASMDHAARLMGPARGARALTLLNQHDGIDCMSCAWPDPDTHRSVAEFCENGAKAIAWEGDTRRCGPEFFHAWSIDALLEQSDYWHGQQGRLTHPMLLRPGSRHYEPVTWDDAFALIAGELKALASPDEAVFYTSGRTSNEAAFLYQLFVRMFGTNNLPDCSNMCHESTSVGLGEAMGLGKGSVTLDDVHNAKVLILIGQNPGTNHPRMLTSLQEAKKRGCTIVAANPMPETGLVGTFQHPQNPLDLMGGGTKIADVFLQVRAGGDAALLKGVLKALLELEDAAPGTVIDRAFVDSQTVGFDAFRAEVERSPWDVIVRDGGVAEADIRALGRLLASTDRFVTCWAMGITQQPNGVALTQEILNLHLLRGAIAKPGAGVCPVRGHSNVQGDRTMGIYEKPKPAFLDRLRAVFGFEPPRRYGLDTVECIRALRDGEAKVFIGLGGNFAQAAPDTGAVAEAMSRATLTVHVSTKLNRSHLVTGRTALILPCLGRTERDVQAAGEQFVTCENSTGVVQTSRGRFDPASPLLLSEVAIVCRLAEATIGDRPGVRWRELAGDYDRVRGLIERAIEGCDHYNTKVRQKGGFYLPNGPRAGTFPTPDNKAHFTAHPLPDLSVEPGQLILTTVRTHDQFNTTVYGLNDRYRGVYNERRVVLMHADDIAERGLRAGDVVDLTSHWGDGTRVARKFIVVPYPIARGCCASYFPETNVLVPLGSTANKSNCPTYKRVIVTVRAGE